MQWNTHFLPKEYFCQAMGIAPALKYQADGGPGIENSMKLLLGSRLAAADRETFFRTQILFWLLAAIDGHGKNRQYHLSMIQPRHFISTAERVGFSSQKAIELMQQMADQTEQVITQVTARLPVGFPKSISSAIFLGLNEQADKIKKAFSTA